MKSKPSLYLYLLYFLPLLFIVFTLSFCKKARVVPGPISPEILKWGVNPSEMNSLLTKSGWTELPEKGDSVNYVMKMGNDEKFDPIMEEVVYPYKVSLYFNNNRLHIARLFRTGKVEETDEFKKNFIKMYSLSVPEWKSGEKEAKTQGGNTYITSSEIYTGNEIIVKLHKNSFISNDSNLRDESIEIQIFSLKENEGISVKGLAESLEK